MLNRKLLISTLLLLILFGSAAYYATSRLTALMSLRWLVKQTGVPLEIKSASWKTSWHQLVRGQIEELEVDAKHSQTNLWIHFNSSGVKFKRNGPHWTIELMPTIRINSLPTFKGSLALELDSLTQSIAGAFQFDLTAQQTIATPQMSGTLKYKTAFVSGVLAFDPKKSSIEGSLSIKGEDLHFEQNQNRAFEIKTVDIQAAPLNLVLEPHFTVNGSVSTQAKSIQILWDGRFLEKDEFSAKAANATIKLQDGQMPFITLSTFNVLKPYALNGSALMQNGKFSGYVKTHLNIETLFADLYKIFEDKLEPLKGLQLKGSADLEAQVSHSRVQSANVSADIKHLELPSRKARASGIHFNLNKSKGRLSVDQANLGPWHTKGLHFQITNLEDHFKIANAAPIIIPIWSDKMTISKIKLLIQHDGSLSGEAGLEGGPFHVDAIQKDFCFSQNNPIAGKLRLSYPNIKFDGQTLSALGNVEGELFNGHAHLGDIKITLASNSKVEASGALNNIDLVPLGQWLKFGKISGNLDVIFRDAILTLTSLGPVPLDYDFTIKGSDGDHRKLHFSAEALDNLIDMMGVKEATNGNPVAAIALSAWRFIGNTFTFLNNLDYFGFRAKTELGYTSLTTFDPPDSKNHYLIHGNSFKMPIKSSSGKDVYPVIMRTEEFQGWLWGRVAWFKTRSKEKAHDKHDESSCTPVW